MAPGLAILVLAILSGFWGTPIGAKNFSMIFVWVVWWGVLMVLFLPFAARAWCAACPLPGAGEWLSRRAFVERANRFLGFGLGWPRRLRNRWLVNLGLILVLLFGLIITTRPWVTALLIVSLILASLIIHLFFERRAFCRYVCPIGGFLGLYAMVLPLELRSKDQAVCGKCRFKSCYRLPNLPYVMSVLSDPFGWGVDLLGMRERAWQPYLTGWLPYLQVSFLAIGLGLTLKVGKEITVRLLGERKEVVKATVPFGVSAAAMTLFFLALFSG